MPRRKVKMPASWWKELRRRRRRRKIATGMITVAAYDPAVLSVAKIRGTMLALCNAYAKLLLADFNKTVETWEHIVNFQHHVSYKRGMASVEVYTTDEAYFYVNKGTLVRRAVMTADFEAKTEPEFIGSFDGAGDVAFVGKNVQQPGIVSRKFTIVIHDKHAKDFASDVLYVAKKGLMP